MDLSHTQHQDEAVAYDVRHVPLTHPDAAPLLRSLGEQYDALYGHYAADEMTKFAAEEFEPPHGAFVLLYEHATAIAGGAFRRHDAHTAELKRIWTHPDHRRRGLGRAVVLELEREAAARGFTRIHLTTGPRQPEAVALYLALGYTALFDVDQPPFAELPFEKSLAPGGAEPLSPTGA